VKRLLTQFTRLSVGLKIRPQAQALERKPSNAWAIKIPALTRPITAVSVSIIAKVLLRPCIHRTTALLHSQKDSFAGIEIDSE
jgi:hypothetical protein